MKFWTDKQGNELTFTQFMKRWKSGIEGVTPHQKVKTEIWGTRIILLGLILGLIMSIISYKSFWWVAIVLTGALIINGVNYLGLKQKDKQFKNIEINLDPEPFDLKKEIEKGGENGYLR